MQEFFDCFNLVEMIGKDNIPDSEFLNNNYFNSISGNENDSD